MAKTEREKVKLASRSLLDSLRKLIARRERWTEKEQTQAEVEVLILDNLFAALPTPPFTAEEKESAAKRVYQHVWQQFASGNFHARHQQRDRWFFCESRDQRGQTRAR